MQHEFSASRNGWDLPAEFSRYSDSLFSASKVICQVILRQWISAAGCPLCLELKDSLRRQWTNPLFSSYKRGGHREHPEQHCLGPLFCSQQNITEWETIRKRNVCWPIVLIWDWGEAVCIWWQHSRLTEFAGLTGHCIGRDMECVQVGVVPFL